MNRALAHRGPDGGRVYVRDGIGLAHMRLAVVDLERGGQPFVSEDGQTVLILNGEIYNHDDLRSALVREGRRFRTRSDTEVVLQLYESMGERCVDRLRGMFAFALWDGRKRQLWLVRDRLGIKPLYYYWNGEVFVFGSEPKSVLEYPGVPRDVDERAVDAFLTFGYVPSPQSIYRGMAKLEAGHMLSVTERGVAVSQYWDVNFTTNGSGAGESLPQAVRRNLNGAVSGQLGSDVPMGALLSGGVDSTAVLGFMTGRLGEGIPTFTATFPGTQDEDRTYAKMAAERYGSGWHEIAIHEPSSELLDRLAWHFDEPFADPSAVPTFLLCEMARKHVTVCLSGDGGDESFGGYRRYRENETRRAMRQLVPEDKATAFFEAAGRLAPDGKWLPKPFRFRALFRSAAEHPMAAYGNEMSICGAESKRRLYSGSFTSALAGYDALSTVEACFRRSNQWDSTSQLQYTDFKTYLADGILTKVDRASMAHGLEVRVPLLDHMLVEFTASLPSSSKAARRGKTLLKDSLRGIVPSPILGRRKRGFTPPLVRWLEGGTGKLFESRVLHGDPFVSRFLDMDRVRTLWADHRAGATSRPLLIWSILALETWGLRFQ